LAAPLKEAHKPKQWLEVLQRQDLVVAICQLAGGPPVPRHLALSAVCRAWHDFLTKVWDELDKSFPCRLYVAFGLDGEFGSVDSAERFDPQIGKWEVLPSPGMPRAGPAAAVMVGRFYVVGGEACGEALRDARRFDPWTGSWEVLPQMHVGRIRPAAVAHGGFLYVVGGHDGYRIVDSVERYDPRRQIWEVLPPMAKPRYACAATVQGGKLYAVGGEIMESGVCMSAECCDLADGEVAGTWQLLCEMKAPSYGSAVAVADGMAFVLGGLSLRGQVMKDALQIPLDSFSDIDFEASPLWKEIDGMPTPRHLASVATFNGGTCVVGGKGHKFQTVSNVEVFYPRLGEWQVLPPLPWPRFRAAVAGGHL